MEINKELSYRAAEVDRVIWSPRFPLRMELKHLYPFKESA